MLCSRTLHLQTSWRSSRSPMLVPRSSLSTSDAGDKQEGPQRTLHARAVRTEFQDKLIEWEHDHQSEWQSSLQTAERARLDQFSTYHGKSEHQNHSLKYVLINAELRACRKLSVQSQCFLRYWESPHRGVGKLFCKTWCRTRTSQQYLLSEHKKRCLNTLASTQTCSTAERRSSNAQSTLL